MVAEKEELSKLRPPLSGDEIMEIFDLEPGPSVGIIMNALYEQRINDGEVSKEEATKLAKEVPWLLKLTLHMMMKLKREMK